MPFMLADGFYLLDHAMENVKIIDLPPCPGGQ